MTRSLGNLEFVPEYVLAATFCFQQTSVPPKNPERWLTVKIGDWLYISLHVLIFIIFMAGRGLLMVSNKPIESEGRRTENLLVLQEAISCRNKI